MTETFLERVRRKTEAAKRDQEQFHKGANVPHPGEVKLDVSDVAALLADYDMLFERGLGLLTEKEQLREALLDAALGWSREADPRNLNMRRARVAAGLDPDPSSDYATGGALCLCGGRGWYESEDGDAYCVCPSGKARRDRDAANEHR